MLSLHPILLRLQAAAALKASFLFSSVRAVTGQQPVSQVELERQQILNEMKKKTSLLTDGSWIRQRSTDAAGGTRESDVLPMRRCDAGEDPLL